MSCGLRVCLRARGASDTALAASANRARWREMLVGLFAYSAISNQQSAISNQQSEIKGVQRVSVGKALELRRAVGFQPALHHIRVCGIRKCVSVNDCMRGAGIA